MSARGAPKHGLHLRLDGALPGGEIVSEVWESWATSQDDGLRWELRRIVPSLGWVETKSTPLHKHIKHASEQIRVALKAVGIDEAQHIGRSRQALILDGAGDEELRSAEPVAWVSTSCLLLGMANFSESKRSVRDKQATLFLELVLSRCLSPSAAASIDAQKPGGEAAQQCRKEPMTNDLCTCVSQALHKQFRPHAMDKTPQQFIAAMIQYCWRLRACAAMARWTGELLHCRRQAYRCRLPVVGLHGVAHNKRCAVAGIGPASAGRSACEGCRAQRCHSG